MDNITIIIHAFRPDGHASDTVSLKVEIKDGVISIYRKPGGNNDEYDDGNESSFTKKIYEITDYERIVTCLGTAHKIDESYEAILVELGASDTPDCFNYVYISGGIYAFESQAIINIINSTEDDSYDGHQPKTYMITADGVLVPFISGNNLYYFNQKDLEEHADVEFLRSKKHYSETEQEEYWVEFGDSEITCDISYILEIPDEYVSEIEITPLYVSKYINELPVSHTTTSSGYRCVAENLYVDIRDEKINVYKIPSEYLDNHYKYTGPNIAKFRKAGDVLPDQFYTQKIHEIKEFTRVVEDITKCDDDETFDRFKVVLIENGRDEKSYNYTMIQSNVFEFKSAYKIDSVFIYYYSDLVIPYFITEHGVYISWGGLFFHTWDQIVSYNTTKDGQEFFWQGRSDGVLRTPTNKKIDLREYYKFPIIEQNALPMTTVY